MKKLVLLFFLFFLFIGCSTLKNSAIGTYYSDSNISYHILQQLKHHPELYKKNHIVTTVYQGTVLIAGQVLQASDRIEVENLVHEIPGIKRIYNELDVAGGSTTLTRSSDSWITSKVKSKMLLNTNLKSRKIKIVTENGIVYLLGTVTNEQAQLAETVARKVPGVQRVIPLFVSATP